MLASVLFLIACSLLVQDSAALEALVALKTIDNVTCDLDIQTLKNVVGVSQVYRVKPIHFWTIDGKGKEQNHWWSYMVLGKGLKDEAAQNAMVSEVSGMDFVERFAWMRLSGNSTFTANHFNAIIKEADPAHFVERPMMPATPKPDCSPIELKKGQRLNVVSVRRSGEQMMKMGVHREMLNTIIPALGASVKYAGSVDSSGVWDVVGIIDWINAATWCEYAQSQQYVEDITKKKKHAYDGEALAWAVEV